MSLKRYNDKMTTRCSKHPILNAITVGIIHFNSLGKILDLNETSKNMLDLAIAEKTNYNIQDFLCEKDIKRYSELYFNQENYKQICPIKILTFGIITEKSFSLVWNLKSKSNKNLKTKINVSYIKSKNGTLTYVATIQDLSQELDIEVKIKERNDIIKSFSLQAPSEKFNFKARSKDLLKAVTESLSIERASIWLCFDDRIECLQLFEKSKNTFSEGNILYEKNFPLYFKEFKTINFIKADNALQHHATQEFTEAYLIPLNIKSMIDTSIYQDGKLHAILCCETVGELKEWTQEDVVFLESICKLMTLALKDQKEYLSNINNIQNAKLISLGEMAGSIAHEINNPLTSLQLRLELILQNISNRSVTLEQIEKEINDLMNMSTRIGKIIKGLGQYSRNTEGMDFEPVIAKAVIENTLFLCEEKIKYNAIKLIKNFDDSSIKFLGNSVQISQVLINLLNNAMDAIHKLKDKWIDISLYKEGEDLLISVTDSGSGIPESISENIMIPFFTTKEIGKGTGLGLSVSKGLIEAHKGLFYIDRTCLNTRFIIKLNLLNT